MSATGRFLARRYRGTLTVALLIIGYATLYPLVPLRPPGEATIAAFFRPRYVPAFDVALNVLAYVPLGTLACLFYRQSSASTAAAIGKAVGLCAGVSLALECAQLFVPFRVGSLHDVAANAIGALAGALAFAEPFYGLVTRPLGALRERLFIDGPWGDSGLVLLVLWLIAQLNPAVPFSGAGHIAPERGATAELATLQWFAVAMSICGFGLFVSVVLRGTQGALRSTVVLLTIALWLKFAAASVMLKPHLSAEWVSTGRMVGLAGGLAAFYPLRRLPRPARIYLALLLVLAGALFAKIFGAYSAMEELLRLFSWPYGQLANFATLTQYLHEWWPFVAVAFLIALFLWERRHAVR